MSSLVIKLEDMVSVEIFPLKKKKEKFTERMSRKTHFTEAEVERLVEIHRTTMVCLN